MINVLMNSIPFLKSNQDLSVSNPVIGEIQSERFLLCKQSSDNVMNVDKNIPSLDPK